MKKILCAFIFLLLAREGFSQTSKLLRYLPANTEMVMAFNPFQISKKVPGDVFRQSNIYREMMKEKNAEVEAFLKDPSITGIAVATDLLFTMETDTSAERPANIVNVFGALKNADLFTTTIQKYFGEKGTVETYGVNKVLNSGEYGPSLAWNNEVFVITSGNKNAIKNMVNQVGMDDSLGQDDYEKKWEEVKEKFVAMAKERCFKLLTANDKNAFLLNNHLTALLNEQGDFKIWSNGAGAFQSLRKISPALSGLLGKLQGMAGTDKTSIINFENGKITGNTRNYVNEKVAALYKKYPPSTQNFNLIKKIPAEAKPIIVMNVSANPDMAKEMLKSSGLGEILDSLRSHLPFDPDLLTTSFGNQAMFAVVNIPEEKKITEDEYYRKSEKPFKGIHVIAAMPIKNKENFEKLYAALSKAIAGLKEKMDTKQEPEDDEEDHPKGNFLKDIFSSLKLSVKYNDSICVLGFSGKITESYMNNTGNATVPDWFQSSAQYPMIMQFNFKDFITMMAGMGSRRPDEGDKKDIREMFNVFGDMRVTSGNFSNGAVNSHIEFSFADKDQNALLQIFQLMDKMMAQQKKDNRREGNIDMNNDTEMKVLPPPPPPPPKEGKPKKKN